MNLNLPWAFITGATSGIGRATAVEMAKQGYHLFVTGRREDRLTELATEISSRFGSRCLPLCYDIQNRKQLAEQVRLHNSLLKDLQVVVNNAGLALGVDPFQQSSEDDWDQMIDTNMKGLLYTTRALLPFLMERGTGDVINIGSVAGRWVYPGGHVYCATKFAVRALSEGLRMDLKGAGIRVTNIEPGMVETEFSQVRLQNEKKAQEVYQDMRPLTPEDVAESIAWCLARPRHMNVQELVLFPTDQAAVGMVHRRTDGKA